MLKQKKTTIKTDLYKKLYYNNYYDKFICIKNLGMCFLYSVIFKKR